MYVPGIKNIWRHNKALAQPSTSNVVRIASGSAHLTRLLFFEHLLLDLGFLALAFLCRFRCFRCVAVVAAIALVSVEGTTTVVMLLPIYDNARKQQKQNHQIQNNQIYGKRRNKNTPHTHMACGTPHRSSNRASVLLLRDSHFSRPILSAMRLFAFATSFGVRLLGAGHTPQRSCSTSRPSNVRRLAVPCFVSTCFRCLKMRASRR